MPSLVDVVLHPERRRAEPPAERVDLRLPLYLGLSAWTVALVVGVVLWATGTIDARLTWTAVAGLSVGGLGLLWERRNRARYRGADPSGPSQTPPATPAQTA